MKIAFIGQKGIPAVSGGVEKHVEDLSTQLVQRGHDVTVYTRPSYSDKNLTEYKGVQLISLPTLATKNFDAITHTFFAILDLLRRKVDIVHFHGIGPSSLIPFVRLIKPSAKIVATVHSQDYCQDKWGLVARLYLKFGERIACAYADKTIAISKSLTRLAHDRYKTNAEYIPNGVKKAVFVEADEITKLWNLSGNDYILAVSRLIPNKGLHYLVDAYNKIKTDKKLVIVGDGAFTDTYVSNLKAAAASNPNIIFTGAQKGKVLEELFSNASLFAHPSNLEGLSIALLEAMSYGKVSIVSDIPENLEAIEDTGIEFAHTDAVDLASKLKFALANPEALESLGLAAKQRVATEYNWDTITASTENLYADLIAKDLRKRVAKLTFATRFSTLL